jgi:outer membrane protein assembly factor BamD (BamD/ComL family)
MILATVAAGLVTQAGGCGSTRKPPLPLTPAAAQPVVPGSTRDTWRLEGDNWNNTTAPRSADEQTIADARAALADERPGRAIDLLDPWIETNQNLGHPLLAEALLLRGDAHTANGDEFQALYDYEELAINHPGTEQFGIANERELDIGTKYINGLKRRWLGMRVARAENIGEELLVRVQERLPGTAVAEKAAITLADYYYNQRALVMAADAYEIYTTNFPAGPNIDRARQRRIFANIARFKGPNYDAAGLVDAKALIREYAARDPEAAQASGMSDALVSKLDESKAAQLLDRANWYVLRRDPVGARATWRRIIRNYPQTLAAQNALNELKARGWDLGDTTATQDTPAQPAAEPDR